MDKIQAVIIKRIINEDLRILSDKSLQYKKWVVEEGRNASCFSEIISDFLYETEEIIENYKKYELSEKDLLLLKELFEMMNSYDENISYSDKEIVNDPKWDEIRQFAKKVYMELTKTM